MIKVKVTRFDPARGKFLVHADRLSMWITPAELEDLKEASDAGDTESIAARMTERAASRAEQRAERVRALRGEGT